MHADSIHRGMPPCTHAHTHSHHHTHTHHTPPPISLRPLPRPDHAPHLHPSHNLHPNTNPSPHLHPNTNPHPQSRYGPDHAPDPHPSPHLHPNQLLTLTLTLTQGSYGPDHAPAPNPNLHGYTHSHALTCRYFPIATICTSPSPSIKVWVRSCLRPVARCTLPS